MKIRQLGITVHSLMLITLWSVTVIWCLPAFSLGLGDVTVTSVLNQPLEAEIELTSVRPGETEGLIINLASEDAFLRAGVDRVYHLTKLKFKLATKPDGRQYIRVITNGPVREPFLNFLIDIDWPKGRLVREYAILLDPPNFVSQQPVVPQVPQTVAQVPQTVAQVPDAQGTVAGEVAPIKRELATDKFSDVDGSPEIVPEAFDAEDILDLSKEPLPEIHDDSPAFGNVVSTADNSALPDIVLDFDESIPYNIEKTEKYLAEFEAESLPARRRSINVSDHQVSRGDTLWDIAETVKPADVSINQAMLGILRANPDAFVDNNINNLKTGVVLRIPERDEMLSLSAFEALQAAKEQNAIWREYRDQLAGIPVNQMDSEEDFWADDNVDQESTGDLSLLAPGADDEGIGRASGLQDGSETGAISDTNLLLAKEALAAEKVEKAELQSRLSDLSEQVDMMQRLITLKDEELATLRARLAEVEGGVVVDDTLIAESASEDESTSDDALESIDDLTLDDSDTNEIADEALLDEGSDEGTETELPDSELVSEQLPQEESIDEALETEPVAKATTPAQQVSKPSSAESEPQFALGTIVAILVVLLLLLAGLGYFLFTRLRKGSEDVALTESANVEANDAESITILNQEVIEESQSLLDKVTSLLDKVTSLLDKVKGLFSKSSPPTDNAEVIEFKDNVEVVESGYSVEVVESEEPASTGDGGDSDSTGEYEGELPETLAVLEPTVEAAAQVEEDTADDESNDYDKTSQFLAAKPEALGEQTVESGSAEQVDDTAAEADVYLAYGLFDQAEDLLKGALAQNPTRDDYTCKLLETYFASKKQAEFEALATNFKEKLGGASNMYWDKVIAMGQELIPDSALFVGQSSDLKVSDFAPTKPQETDIDVGEAENAVEPDFDLGDVTDIGEESDFEISESFEAVDLEESLSDTLVTSAETVVLDEDIDVLADVEDESNELDMTQAASDWDIDDDEEIDLGMDDEIDLEFSEEELEETLTSEYTIGGDTGEHTVITLDEDEEDVSVSEDIDDMGSIDLGDMDMESLSLDDVDDDLDTLMDLDEDIGDIAVDDEVETKLDLARAYIDMDDKEGAKSSLEEVMSEGTEAQRKEAESLLQKIA